MSLPKAILFLPGIAALTALAAILGPDQIRESLFRITAGQLAFLFLLQLITLLAGAWIWHFLLRRKDRISFGRVFLINQAGGLIESLTPSVKFGGEAAKLYLFRKATGISSQGLAGTLMMHKFLTMAPFVFLCLMLFYPALHYFELPLSFHVSLFLLVLLCTGLGWFCCGCRTHGSSELLRADTDAGRYTGSAGLIKRLCSRAGFFFSRARLEAANLLSARQTLGIMLVSLLIWVFYPLKVYLACHFLGLEVHPLIIGLGTLFAYMISMLPLLPGGLGTYEAGMTMFLTLGGLSPAEGLAVSLLSRLTTFWFPLLLSALSCLILAWQDRLTQHEAQSNCP